MNKNMDVSMIVYGLALGLGALTFLVFIILWLLGIGGLTLFGVTH